MAKREIVVELQLSDTNAVAELGRLEIETKQYQRELKALNAEIAKNGQATRQQQEAVGTLNASIRRNQTVIRELKNDLSGATDAGLRFRDKMAEATLEAIRNSGIIGKLDAQLATLKNQMAANTATIAANEKAMAGLAAKYDRGEIEAKEYNAQLAVLRTQSQQAGTANEKLSADVNKVSGAISGLDKKVEDLTADLKAGRITAEQYKAGVASINSEVAKASGAFTQGVSDLKNYALGMIGVAGAITGLISVFKQAINAAEEQRQALAALDQAIKTTGAAAGFTSDQLAKMATELQKTTLFGDEEILRGVSLQLLTFTNIAGEEFARAQKAALDLSTVLGTDLQSSAIQVGKALNDPITGLTALRKVGVSFTVDQKELIRSLAETGQTAEAQRIILAELERQYGGQAEAMAAASNGAKQLGNAWGDLLEVLGDSSWIKKFNGFLQTAVEGLTLLVSKSNELLGGDIGDGEGSWLRERNSIAAFTEEADKYLSARERMILQDRDVRNSAVRNFQEQARATIEFEKRTGGLIELQQEWRKELLAAEPGSRKYAFLMVALKQLSTEVAVAEKEKAVSTEKASKSTSTSVGALRERLSALKEERDALSINDKEGLAANAASIAALEKQLKAIDASAKATENKTAKVKELTQAEKDLAAQMQASANEPVTRIEPRLPSGTALPQDDETLARFGINPLGNQLLQQQTDETLAIWQRHWDEVDKIAAERRDAQLAAAQELSDSLGSLSRGIIALEQAQTSAQVEEIDRRIDAQRAAGQSTVELEAQRESAVREGAKRAWDVQRAFAFAQIAIDTAKAISSLTSAAAANPANAVTFGGAGAAQFAAGVIQIAANMAQAIALLSQSPGFEEGGYTSRRRRDDEPVGVVHANEYVVPAPIVRNPRGKRLIDELERMRMGHPVRYAPPFIGGGIGTNNNVRFARGTGLAQTGITAADVATADLSRAIMSMPAPVVRVDEINRVQRRVNVIESISRT